MLLLLLLFLIILLPCTFTEVWPLQLPFLVYSSQVSLLTPILILQALCCHLTSVHRGNFSLIFMSFIWDKCCYDHFMFEGCRQREDSLSMLEIELQISDSGQILGGL